MNTWKRISRNPGWVIKFKKLLCVLLFLVPFYAGTVDLAVTNLHNVLSVDRVVISKDR